MRQKIRTRSHVVLQAQKMKIAIASLLIGASFGAAMVTGASAQERGTGRYTMHKTDDGFVRLDTETGAIALCRKEGNSFNCRDVADANAKAAKPDGREEGGGDVNALRRDNRELKDEIARLEELLGLRGPNAGRSPSAKNFKLPSEKDVDQAFDYFERMLRKFQDRLKRLEKDKEVPGPERQL